VAFSCSFSIFTSNSNAIALCRQDSGFGLGSGFRSFISPENILISISFKGLYPMPDYYDLTTIAATTGASYGVLRRYAELPTVQQKLGAESLPGVKGVRWPESSLPLWQSIIDAHQRKIITPGTVAAYLQQSNVSLQQSENAGAIVPLQQSSVALSRFDNEAREFLQALAMEVGNALRQSTVIPHYPDILTAQQAADYLQCSTRALRKQFPPAFRIGKSARGDRWRKSSL
jgi:hypothetical protein